MVVAPQPEDLIWENLPLTKKMLMTRDLVVRALTVGLIFGWTVPVAFIASLTTLDKLQHLIPALEPLVNSNAGVRLFLQGFLPTIALTLFMALLPQIVRRKSSLSLSLPLPLTACTHSQLCALWSAGTLT